MEGCHGPPQRLPGRCDVHHDAPHQKRDEPVPCEVLDDIQIQCGTMHRFSAKGIIQRQSVTDSVLYLIEDHGEHKDLKDGADAQVQVDVDNSEAAGWTGCMDVELAHA